MKRKTGKARDSLSKRRQGLWEKLGTMEQRVKDMEVAFDLSAPDRAAKTLFCRQEAAKLREQILKLEKGVSRQRAWARGKTI